MKKILFFALIICFKTASAQLPVALFSATNNLCPGTCTIFTNSSTNATSYQWIFEAGFPPTSTDSNPSYVCYNTPGSYDVTLIAANSNGSDTLFIPDYVTVFPYPPVMNITLSHDTLFATQGFVSYQWYVNGNLIPGATDYFYVVQSANDVNVVGTDINGCEVEAGYWWTIGINENSTAPDLHIYPNPVNDKLYLNCIHDECFENTTSIQIYNLLGENVISVYPTSANSITVDVHMLSRGFYTIEISSGSKVTFFKFAKD